MVSIISMNVNKTKLPTTKGFTAGYETWFTGATLIEIGVFPRVGEGGYYHIWARYVCAAGKGMVFKQFTVG